MAYSKYKSTKETTHAARVSRLLVDPCTDLFRDLLRDHITEMIFPSILRQKKQMLIPILNKAQRGLLYPTKGSFTGTYNDFDLSLLYVLLRNTTSIVPHKKGWAKPPDPSDRSLSANIDRIREIRNTYCGHAARVSLSDSEFQKLWQDLTVIIGELEGNFPGGCTTYTNAAKQIEIDTMDPEQEKKYLDIIDTQHQHIEVLKETTIKVKEQVSEVHEQVFDVQVQITGLKSDVKEQVSEVQEQVSEVQEQVSEVQEQITGLKFEVQEQVTGVQEQVTGVQEQVTGVQEQVTDVQEQVTGVQEQVSGVQEQVSDVQEQVSGVQEQVSGVQEQVSGVQEQFTGLQTTVEKMNKPDAKSPIPPNVREQYDIDIQEWREEDKLYYETHSYPSIMQIVRNQPYVTFVGVPGSGKSVMAHHIALKLQEEGYEVVPTIDVRKIEEYGDPSNPQVFVIDDVVGVFGLQKTYLDLLNFYEKKITHPYMPRSRTLMTCRETVFNETLNYKTFFTKEETVIKLHSSDNALDDNDKKQIFQKYGLNADLILPELLTSTSHMFPLLCKLFSRETKFQALGSKFFMNPVYCIIDEFYDMQRENRLNYATLVLCMLNGNSLSKGTLKDRENEHFLNLKSDTLENCKLEHSTDTFKFMDALSAMEGTYTKQCGAQYTFIHDSMLEICAYQYGKQFPDQILLFMSSSYIANYVKPEKNEQSIVDNVKEKQNDPQYIRGNESGSDSDGMVKERDDKSNETKESFDLCIRVCEDQYPLLAERLYRDIQNMELYDVFRNRVLKHSQVGQAFIDVLETKSYTELKFLFLFTKGNVDKIVSKRECVEKESEESGVSDEWRRQNILVDRRSKRDKGGFFFDTLYNIRVISWLIYYRHHRILQYLIEQTEQHNEIIELFRITRYTREESKISRHMVDDIDQKEREIESSQEREVFREQHRLLLLSCYSGDEHTVKIVLPHVCSKSINWIDHIGEYRGDIWSFYLPLSISCKRGHTRIVQELVKAGADVNLIDKWGYTPLINACEKGHVDIVQGLLKAGTNVDLKDKWGDTPLKKACWNGHVDIVQELVKAGCDVNLKGKRGDTPLLFACDIGHMDILKELVKAGADVNVQDKSGITPLMTACKRGHMCIVEELIKADADINLQDTWGYTSLITACREGYVSIVEDLVRAGSDVNLQDEFGNTPLITSCNGGRVRIVEELVKAEADVNLQNNDGESTLVTVSGKGDTEVLDIRRNTPLIAACKKGHVRVVEELLKAGADVNLQDTFGCTPLITACKEGHMRIVEELVEAGGDVNLRDKLGCTPLITASKEGHVHIVKELVKARAYVNLQDIRGNTPLKDACKGGYVRIVEDLLKAGADVNIQDKFGCSPLITACKEGHMRIVEELVKAGGDVNLQDKFGCSPLITACKEGHVYIVEELVKAGTDINLQDKLGCTPLITACKEGHMRIVEELVKAGGDVNLQDKLGCTPLITASKEGHVHIVEELIKAGGYINQQDIRGNTPLKDACKEGHVRIVEDLLKAGADVNLQDKRGCTPLITSCKEGHAGIAEDLMKAGSNVNLQDKWGYTPLIIACKKGHADIVEQLLKADAVVNIQDGCGKSALIFSCKKGYVSIVEELVKTGVDVNIQDRKGNTPLITACKRGHVNVVEVLVKAGADVNLKDRWKDTPLLNAVRNGSISIVKLLVEHGADLATQVDICMSPVCIALILNKIDVMKYCIKEQNETIPDKFVGNAHLFNCLVSIRHAGVKTDSRDDLVVTDRSVWCIDREGDLLEIIRWGDCGELRRLLWLGLNVNQRIQFTKFDSIPLFHSLTDDWFVIDKLKKVRILLEAGADVSFEIKHERNQSLLDREGVSVLERTKRLVCEYGERDYFQKMSEYKSVMCEIKKHVRRHSV